MKYTTLPKSTSGFCGRSQISPTLKKDFSRRTFRRDYLRGKRLGYTDAALMRISGAKTVPGAGLLL
jgi:hypothetical protein